MSWEWFLAHWSNIVADSGIIGGLLFTGFGFWRNARILRGETLIEITRQHRELWMYYDDHPGLHGLFEENRDMKARPLEDEEVRFANFLFLHLRAAYGANRAKIHRSPEHVAEDWRRIFRHPAIRQAWDEMKRLHDRQFVAVVEAYLSESKR